MAPDALPPSPTPWLWPVSAECRRITSGFGPRIHPVTGEVGAFHSGVDIAVPQCSLVRSPCAGKVVSVWIDLTHGGGQSIVIESESGGIRFGFAHLSMPLVSKGDMVTRGQPVAMSGGKPGTEGAGRSTGPHLHLTCRLVSLDGGRLVDPMSMRWDMWTPQMEREAKR